jgi:vacuolar-type H+-ATPase subunit C/Vma6
MRASHAIKLTVERRLAFEITLARCRIERAYKRARDEIHHGGKVSDAAAIELHEAEQILSALERVSGDFYRRHLAAMKAYREEQKQQAKTDADYVLTVASSSAPQKVSSE